MAGIGELFVELGVFGNTDELKKFQKELDAAAKKADNLVKTMQEEIAYNDKLAEVTDRVTEATKQLNNALSEEEKQAAQAAITAAKAQKERLVKLRQQKILAKNAKEAADRNKEQIALQHEQENQIKGVVRGLIGFIGAVTAAAIAVNKLTNDLVKNNQTMLNLTRTTDIAQSTFQKWGGIGKILGIENADQQLAGLNDRLFDLMLTGQGARGFQLAGVNPIGQDAEGVLEQLRARISGMSDTAASYLLQQMGLDPQMLHLLRMGKEDFEALGQTIKKYQLIPKQSKSIQQMNMQLQIAGIRLKYLKDKAILAIMPYWVRLVESFANVTEILIKVASWVNKNAKAWLVLGGIIGANNIKWKELALLFKNINRTFAKLILAVPKFGRAIMNLGAKFTRAFLPLTAAYLILDDLATYFEGGDSLTGRVIDWINETGSDFSQIFGQIMGGDITGGLSALFEKLLDVLTDIQNTTSRILEILLNILTFGGWDKFQNSKWRRFLLPTVDEAIEDVAGQPTGYAGALPHLSSEAVRNVTNNTTADNSNTKNMTVNQNIKISTNQPAQDIQQELNYVNYAFA